MPMLSPYGCLLSNLLGRLDPERLDYLPPEVAHERLVRLAGEDYGFDARRWLRWLVEHGRLREGEYTVIEPAAVTPVARPSPAS
jgi:hypothetical protein